MIETKKKQETRRRQDEAAIRGTQPGNTQATFDENEAPLLKRNFIIMAAAGALIIIGFLLMAGQGSSVNAYNPDIFSSRRIVIGPLLSFIGFVVMGIAIIIKPKN